MSPLYLYQRLLSTRLSEEEYEEVESWIQEYPYFALSHFLKARQTKTQESLFKAALYSPNRALLKRFMDGSMMLYEKKLTSMLNEQHESASRKFAKANNTTFSILHFEEQTQKGDTDDIPFSVFNEKVDSMDVFLNYDMKVLYYKYKYLINHIDDELKRFKSEIERTFPDNHSNQHKQQHENLWLGDDTTSSSHAELQEKIIDDFLAQQPKVSRANAAQKVDQDPTVTQSVLPDQELASETLAQLHVKQNNIAEAIRIYQKLSLLFPEKSVYFADQIKKIS